MWQEQPQEGAPKKEADFWHVNVIPVAPFLEILKSPTAFAEGMEKKAKEVLLDWQRMNKGVKNPKDRVVAEKQFVLAAQSFRGPRGVLEQSQVEFQLTTWAYTMAAQKVDIPDELLLRDVKVKK